MFAKIKTIFRDRNMSFYRNIDREPIKIQNGQFHYYCVNMYGKIRMKRIKTIITLYYIEASPD